MQHGQRQDQDGDFGCDVERRIGVGYVANVQATGLLVVQRPSGVNRHTLEDGHRKQDEKGGNEETHDAKDSNTEVLARENAKIETQDGDLDPEDGRGPEDLTKVVYSRKSARSILAASMVCLPYTNTANPWLRIFC